MTPFSESCWKTLHEEKSSQQCALEYLVSHLKIGVSTLFYQAEPDVMACFSKVSFPIDFLNTTILDMTEHKVDA